MFFNLESALHSVLVLACIAKHLMLDGVLAIYHWKVG